MPRIPTRLEPYSSPARQQRHYKSKRDRTLKALGSASYINGSQFAVILVNAKGEVESFASELFKPKLGEWFDQAVKEEASRIVLDEKSNRASASKHQPIEVEIADEDGAVYSVSGDILADHADIYATSHSGLTPDGSPCPTPTRSRRPAPQLSTVDVALANQLFTSGTDTDDILTPSSTLAPSTTETAVSYITVSNTALDEWFCNQFHRLQQTTTKLVAKCWIKVR